MVILQLNKGNSDLNSKVQEINNLLVQYKPHILILNELNLDHRDKVTPKMFPQYTLEVDNLREVDGLARTGILIHKTINFKRRHDLETSGISTVWIQTTNRGHKPLLLQAIYRQFRRIRTPHSNTTAKQKIRWTKICDKWEQALEEDIEQMTLGDLKPKFEILEQKC